MFEVGQVVVYGSEGVYSIDDIRTEKFGTESRRYYVLSSFREGASSTTVFVPTDSAILTARIKPLISFADAEALIAAMPHSVIEWQDDAKTRTECFRRILERGERKELISLMRTVYLKKQELAEVGRRIYAADENAMKRAERMIFDEFSVVLGVGDDEIIKMIDEKVKTA